MADIKSPTERYKAIADAIREKNGTTELMHPADMPQAILDIVSGGGDVIIGANYESVVYNEDDTITLTDTDGVEHTMECEYTDGKLTSVKYDGKAIALTYDGDVLVKIGNSAVDMRNAPSSSLEPLDHTVTFMVENEPYEVVSVKDGNSVNAPATEPTKEDYKFFCWNNADGEPITFPHTPTGTYNLLAEFIQSYASKLYSYYGVNRATDPYILLVCDDDDIKVLFGYNMAEDNTKFYYHYKVDPLNIYMGAYLTDLTDYETIFNAIINNYSTSALEAKTSYYSVRNTDDYLTNAKSWTPSAYKSIHYFD